MTGMENVKICEMAKSDLTIKVLDLIEELHKDTSQKIDVEIVEHTTGKVVWFLQQEMKNWTLGKVRRACQLGITGEFDTRTGKINFQTMSSWLKKAKLMFGTEDRENEQAEDIFNDGFDYAAEAQSWQEFIDYLELFNARTFENISMKRKEAYHYARKNGKLIEYRKNLREPEYRNEQWRELDRRKEYDELKRLQNAEHLNL